PHRLIEQRREAAHEEDGQEEGVGVQGSEAPAEAARSARGSVPATKDSMRTPGVPGRPGRPISSTGTKTMLPGIGYSSIGASLRMGPKKSTQMGSAACPPVMSFPSESFFSSKPTQTPAASDGS